VTTRVGAEDTNSLDDLELELRKLPGVRAAGFEEHDEMLLVQLHVGDGAEAGDQPMPVAASRIAARHSHRQVAVEIVRWREPAAGGSSATAVAPAPLTLAPAATGGAVGGDGIERRRPRLLAVLAFPDTDELEVHLIHDGKRTIGRAAASGGLVAAVEATIDAIRELGASLEPRPRWARALDDNGDDRSVVAVALEGVDDVESGIQYGLAAGASPIDAAARSTLDALNRKLTHVL
jgi:hypothetical protein